MSAYGTIRQVCLLAAVLTLALTSCTPEPPEPPDEAEEAVVEAPSEEAETLVRSFVKPLDCTKILPEESFQALQETGLELIRGPGSLSPDPIYAQGQTPEELLGGLSCLFAPPDDEDTGVNIVLSVAAIDDSVRPNILQAFVEEGLNVGQTLDGTGITYWRWGDGDQENTVTALYNAVYADSWYSALIQPGGRTAYDRGVALVDSMRTQTTR
jgi:hypothetical protein